MELSYSRIGTWKRCFRKFYYKYKLGLKTKEKPSPPRLGSMGHAALEAKEKGRDWEQAIVDYWKEEIGGIPEKFIDEDSKEEIDLVKKVVQRYLNQYDYYRSEDEYDLIEPETKFKVKIPETDDYLIGYMDKIIKVPGEGIWLVDYKFTSKDPSKKIQHLELNEQIDYYIWAMSKKFPEENIMGAIWDVISLRLPTVPQPIKSGKRLTKRKMTTDYETYYQAILDNGFDPADYKDYLRKLKYQDNPFFQRGMIDRDIYELNNIQKELISVSNMMNRTNYDIRSRAMGRCSWDCPYQQLCLVDKKGGDVESIIKEHFEYRDGYGQEKQKGSNNPFI